VSDRSILRATHPAFLYGIFPRICLIGFRYAQPFLLSRAVNFSNNPEEPDSTGWGLTAAFSLVFLGIAISSGGYYHMTYRFLVSIRGSLVGLVYAKTIDLSITALDESVAVTLMSNDTGERYPLYPHFASNTLITLQRQYVRGFKTCRSFGQCPLS
jgi:ATP-binding cassette subfamily C (CFTR/MRP) protein 1